VPCIERLKKFINFLLDGGPFNAGVILEPGGDAILILGASIRKTNRNRGYVCHVGESRSGGFWVVIKSESGDCFFGYGKNFISQQTPRIGRHVTFTALPAVIGTKLGRATEVEILRGSKTHRTTDEIVLVYMSEGLTQIVIRTENGDTVLGELVLHQV
jgi:hypothetical protein